MLVHELFSSISDTRVARRFIASHLGLNPSTLTSPEQRQRDRDQAQERARLRSQQRERESAEAAATPKFRDAWDG